MLVPHLDPRRVVLALNAEDKWSAIRELVGLLGAEGAGEPLPLGLDEVAEAVIARERQLTTGLERGIALPHGMLPGDFETRGALAVLREGLEFESLDREPARFIALMVYPDTEEGRRRHLELLSSCIRLFGAEPVRRRLLEAESVEDAWEALVEGEGDESS